MRECEELRNATAPHSSSVEDYHRRYDIIERLLLATIPSTVRSNEPPPQFINGMASSNVDVRSNSFGGKRLTSLNDSELAMVDNMIRTVRLARCQSGATSSERLYRFKDTPRGEFRNVLLDLLHFRYSTQALYHS